MFDNHIQNICVAQMKRGEEKKRDRKGRRGEEKRQTEEGR